MFVSYAVTISQCVEFLGCLYGTLRKSAVFMLFSCRALCLQQHGGYSSTAVSAATLGARTARVYRWQGNSNLNCSLASKCKSTQGLEHTQPLELERQREDVLMRIASHVKAAGRIFFLVPSFLW